MSRTPSDAGVYAKRRSRHLYLCAALAGSALTRLGCRPILVLRLLPRIKLAHLPAARLAEADLALEGLIVPSKTHGIAAAGRPVIAITAKDGEIAVWSSGTDAG